MREKFGKLLFGLLFGLVVAVLITIPIHNVQAQTQGIVPAGATPVTQTATRADAATTCQSSATSAATLTFSAQPGLTFYLTEVDFENMAGASAVTAAAPTTVTTTNLPGLPNWTMASGTTAGTSTQAFSVAYPTGLKSTVASTATTVVIPTFATNQTIRVNACGYYA